jgi:hypothetical protein
MADRRGVIGEGGNTAWPLRVLALMAIVLFRLAEFSFPRTSLQRCR